MLRRTNIKRLFSQREENGVHDFVSFDLQGITLRLISSPPNRSNHLQRLQPIELVKFLERVKGIEPSYSAWEAAALPLSYTRSMAFNVITSHHVSRRNQAP